MTHWRQPWGRVEVAGRGCRLQILDPDTAFSIEPELLQRLGNPVLAAIADPDVVVSSIGARVGRELGTSASLAVALQDQGTGVHAAALALRLSAAYVARALVSLDLDGDWAAKSFERIVLDRLEIEGRAIGTWREWSLAGMHWSARWQLLGAQLSQTFGPLWRRSPYKSGGRDADDYGVPEPNASKAVQWAAMIAKLGFASSTNEVLVEWTPERVIDVVETAARDAEVDRRHQLAAEKRRAAS